MEAGTFPANVLKRPGGEYEPPNTGRKKSGAGKGTRSGIQDKLAITAALTRMVYGLKANSATRSQGPGEPAGSYGGTLLAELPRGNLDRMVPIVRSGDFAAPAAAVRSGRHRGWS